MTVNKKIRLHTGSVLPPMAQANMDDLLTIRGPYKSGEEVHSAPGYMKSTLRSPGPCVRLTKTECPSAETRQTGAEKRPAVCPRCFRPVTAVFSDFDSSPFHEHSYLLMCRNMGKREEMEKIAARFGIRGSTFQPSTRPARATAPHPGAYYSYNGVRTLARQPRSAVTTATDGGPRSGRTYVRHVAAGLPTTTTTTTKPEPVRATGKTVGQPKNARGVEASREMSAAPHRESCDCRPKDHVTSEWRCTCNSGYVYDKSEPACSGHFCDFSHTPPVPVYISPKFMMQNPRDRKQATARRHLSPAVEASGERRPLPANRHAKVPPINSKAGAVYFNRTSPRQENPDTPNHANKTTMDIYLPQLSLSQDSDDESVQTSAEKDGEERIRSDDVCGERNDKRVAPRTNDEME